MDNYENEQQTPDTQATLNEQSQSVINGSPINAESVPVAAVPEVTENTLAGAVGALLFALSGGIIWYLLYQVGFIASISGLIGIICAIKGYEIFAKKLSMHGVIIAVILSFAVIVAAWYLCLASDVYKAYQEWYSNGVVDYAPTYAESVRYAYEFLKLPEVAGGYIKDLLFGLVFCVVGGFSYVKAALRNAKSNKK